MEGRSRISIRRSETARIRGMWRPCTTAIGRDKAMKKILFVCILIFGAGSVLGQNANRPAHKPAPKKNSNSNLSSNSGGKGTSNKNTGTRRPIRPRIPIPDIIKVEPAEAPSGAVIEITIKDPDERVDVQQLNVEIGGHTATLIKVEQSKIVAVVPNMLRPTEGVKSAPAPIRLTLKGVGGKVYENFSVLSSKFSMNVSPDIASIDWVDSHARTVNIRFDYNIPVELWGSVRFFFDDLPTGQIIRMTPRLFTVTLPPDLPEKPSYVVLFYIDNFPRQPYKFKASPPDAGSETTPVQPQSESPTSKSTLVWIGVVAGLGAFLLVAFWIYNRERKKTQNSRSEVEPIEVENLYLPDELPSPLIEACVAGECVLYAGAGLSAQSGFPTWKDFIHGLLKWALDNSYINDSEADSFRAEINIGQSDAVADSIISRLRTPADHALLNSYLQKVFLRSSSPSALHSLLKQIKFSAVLTTNFDNLLERVYKASPGPIYTPKDTDALLTDLTKRVFFILKLYGTLDQPETVMIAPAQYEDAVAGNRLFTQCMETLFVSRTLLFIGASLDGIEAYLTGIRLRKRIARQHYALVDVQGNAWRAKADFLERRYGIKVLPYTTKADYSELTEFINKLTENVATRPDRPQGTGEVSRLQRLHLENIGPFENLDLEFDAKWQILLGDNGVGKSTIIKAIALAICGEKAQPYASRLLRRDPAKRITRGKIVLETDNKTSYETIIELKDGDEAEIISETARPLEAEGWLALGFPPLRTTSWDLLKGPEADIKIKSRAVVEDLLPLVKGDVDPRLDKLKQWIVNQDFLRLKSQSEDEGNHYLNLVKEMFEVINSVIGGTNDTDGTKNPRTMTLYYMGVEKDTNRILLETKDGTNIPLEALSQGIISLIGWVGILMQRLYEVFDQDKDPTKRYALILMDEIDAHMHPEWQRTLVNRLKEKFPEAQFIVTTHSPLVVGGMRSAQVIRFARDKSGKVVTLPVAPDMTLGYTDQILTSMLFGLTTTLDDTTERMQKRYYQLLEMEDRGGDQEEYEMLKRKLMARIPPPSADYEEKRGQQLSEAEMLRQVGERVKQHSPEGGQLLLDRANTLRQIITEGDASDDKSRL